MFLMAFEVQEMAVGWITGNYTVPGQIFASSNFHGPGFIREYSEN